jgi:hypothetical protein
LETRGLWHFSPYFSLEDLYGLLDGKRALSVVFVDFAVINPAGAMVYQYETFNRCRYCKRSSLFVSIARDTQAVLWNRIIDNVFVELDLKPSVGEKDWNKLFDSESCLFFFRIMLPGMAFWTIYETGAEVNTVGSEVQFVLGYVFYEE